MKARKKFSTVALATALALGALLAARAQDASSTTGSKPHDEKASPASPSSNAPSVTPRGEPAQDASHAPLGSSSSPSSSEVATSSSQTTGAAGANDARPPEETPVPGQLLSITNPLPEAESWRRMLARDQRIRFTERTATDARRLLAAEGLSPSRRAVGWMAIGCAHDVSQRVAAEDLALKGAGIERLAAILALGEMGASAEDTLLRLIDSPAEGVGECSLLSLLRIDRPSARRRVDEIASDAAHPLTKAAANLLVFQLDPASSEPGRASMLLLDLRWYAARRFGLVDGQAWPVLVVRSLCLDSSFLHEVVVRSVPRLHKPGVKDALLMELLVGTRPGRLRAAVAAMPRELTQLVENELWQPKDAGEWSILLDEIAAHDLVPLAVELVTRAADVPSIHYRATSLLARVGSVDIASLVDATLSTLSVEERIWACDAMATSESATWTKPIAALRGDDDARVRAAALIAEARMADKKAASDLTAALHKASHADHKVVLGEMCRVAHDPLVGVMLEDALPDLKADEQIDVATVLCLEGRLPMRVFVRKALAADPPPTGVRGAKLVRALRRHGTPEDGEILKQLFPREDDLEMNIELGLSLVALDDPTILPVLDAAVWHLDWHTSILAAGVLADVAGISAVRELLSRPPPEATSNDIRRVGYAIGMWGGLSQVEELSRELRYNSGHPALQGVLLGALSTRTQ